ncbi:hypothetical protein CEXT_608371 [Caerostris extrusa]|uniref:Uncharacterized protein n=1 Tax=Caerostris extrusa TaxID=172846 RepID=A0AAV4TB47_CAEEX|nr:hypothetical protein CEXT_608371 [Caerostris extrusa]
MSVNANLIGTDLFFSGRMSNNGLSPITLLSFSLNLLPPDFPFSVREREKKGEVKVAGVNFICRILERISALFSRSAAPSPHYVLHVAERISVSPPSSLHFIVTRIILWM